MPTRFASHSLRCAIALFAAWLLLLQAFLAGVVTARSATMLASNALIGASICHGAGGGSPPMARRRMPTGLGMSAAPLARRRLRRWRLLLRWPGPACRLIEICSCMQSCALPSRFGAARSAPDPRRHLQSSHEPCPLRADVGSVCCSCLELGVPNMHRELFLGAAGAAIVRLRGVRACHSRNLRSAGRRVLQGGAARAAWL